MTTQSAQQRTDEDIIRAVVATAEPGLNEVYAAYEQAAIHYYPAASASYYWAAETASSHTSG